MRSTGTRKRLCRNLKGIEMKKAIWVLVIILFAVAVGTAVLLLIERRGINEKLAAAAETAKQLADTASMNVAELKKEKLEKAVVIRQLNACKDESVNLKRSLEESIEKECKPKAATPVVKKKAAIKPTSKKPDAIKAPKPLSPVIPPAVPPKHTEPTVQPPKAADKPIPTKPDQVPTVPASAPCIECPPHVIKSQASRYCGFHVVNSSGYSLNLRLVRNNGGWLVVTEVAPNTKVRSATSDTIKAKSGDSCDSLQTAAEQPNEWSGLAKYFKMPDGCTRRRISDL